MLHEILLFGILTDLMGSKKIHLELKTPSSVKDLRVILSENFPKLQGNTSFSVAVNMEYAHDETIIQASDTIALIPPVSGG